MKNELLKLKEEYYYHESEKIRLRQQANKHAHHQREIFALLMKKIDRL